MAKRANLLPLRPGTFVARDGSKHTFSEADVRDIVDSYDPAKHRAPLVIGHPQHDSPAWGWVKQLAFNGQGGVEYQADGVMPEFSGWVNEGRWNQQSVALYPKDHPQNPTPGKFHLRHVGFLGAQPPAIKGYPCPSFAAGEAGVIEFSDWTGLQVAGLFRRIKNFLIDTAGQEKADSVLPEWEIENLTVTAAQKKDEPAPSFSEPQGAHDVETKEQMEARIRAELEAQNKAEREKLARDRAEFAEREAAQRRAVLLTESAAFVGGLVEAGQVLPAQREGLVAFMASLDAGIVIEFGEGEAAVKKPGAEWLRGYLQAQPKVVEFAEHGNRGAAPADLQSAEAISKRAIEFQEAERKAGREITVTAAVEHVTKTAQQ